MIQQKRLHRSLQRQSSQLCRCHKVVGVTKWSKSCISPANSWTVQIFRNTVGERHQAAFPLFLDGEEWDVTCCLYLVGIAEECLIWRRKAESYGCSSKCTINMLLTISWKICVKLWKRLKTGKEDPGAFSLLPGVGWAGLVLILCLKIKVSLRKGRRKELPLRICFAIPSQWACPLTRARSS